MLKKILLILIIGLLIPTCIAYSLSTTSNTKTNLPNQSYEVVQLASGKIQEEDIKSYVKSLTFKKGDIEIYRGTNDLYYIGHSAFPVENNLKTDTEWVVPIPRNVYLKIVAFKNGDIDLHPGNNLYYVGKSPAIPENDMKANIEEWVVPIGKLQSR